MPFPIGGAIDLRSRVRIGLKEFGGRNRIAYGAIGEIEIQFTIVKIDAREVGPSARGPDDAGFHDQLASFPVRLEIRSSSHASISS